MKPAINYDAYAHKLKKQLASAKSDLEYFQEREICLEKKNSDQGLKILCLTKQCECLQEQISKQNEHINRLIAIVEKCYNTVYSIK